jgi:hypothetical protein
MQVIQQSLHPHAAISECVDIKVRRVLDMSGRIDKHIKVRVLKREGDDWKEHVYADHRINAEHTVQQAVLEEYTSFPGTCVRVGFRRAGATLGIDLWHQDQGENAFYDGDLYEKIAEGGEVDIVLVAYKPGGPLPEWASRATGDAHGAWLVSDLLRRLKNV